MDGLNTRNDYKCLLFTIFLTKWTNPGLFFIYFHLSKHTFLFLQIINVKKCASRIWCRDSNSRPLEHESPPITTRPGQEYKLNQGKIPQIQKINCEGYCLFLMETI